MKTDLVLVGGGLANSLVALSLRTRRPEIDFSLLERASSLGGNHTWSFHGTDLEPRARELVGSLVGHSWQGYDVRFPELERRLRGSYHSILSQRLHELLMERCGDRVQLGVDVVEVAPNWVRLADGSRIEARGVLDGRGLSGSMPLELGYQKFVGRVLELRRPHRLERPLLMDARVEQRDGFRFIYVLPFSESSILVEDTRYSDGPEISREAMRAEIERYAAELGIEIARVQSEEEGVLPVVLSGDIEALWNGAKGVPRSGLRAALFHPTTGYSLAEAAGLALAVADSDVGSERLFALTRHRSYELWKRGGFFRLLNRMLFRAAIPEERYRVLQRFYGLSEPLIERFYAGRTTFFDKVRLMTGRPPVPLGRAVGCLTAHRSIAEESQP